MESQNLDTAIQALLSAKLPSEDAIKSILSSVNEIADQEPTVHHLTGRWNIVSNICGHLHDFISILQLLGNPSSTNNFLFLGDLVCRGKQSVESFLLACAFKAKFPKNVIILRGKLEVADITAIYGHDEQCKKVCPNVPLEAFYNIFNVLPLVAIVNSKAFCVHGGIAQGLETIEDYEKLNRKGPTPKEGGPITDLIWSDPFESEEIAFKENPRGAGKLYGVKPVEEFLTKNKLDMIVRGNQLQPQGFGMNCNQKVLTIFSAPNYCYKCANKGAVLIIKENNDFEVKSFGASAGNLEDAKA